MPGRYYITKKIAKGPVSELFLALDATDRSGQVSEFHLVRFREEYCSNEGFLASLEEEANVELALTHEGVLKLVDYGFWEARCFLVYEKHTALSMAEALAISRKAGKAIDALYVAALALQLLEVLLYAHSLGDGTGGRRAPVFQSGFSPECVELSATGYVKVCGFTRSQKGTRPSFLDMALGRMPYLSPAIWDGQKPNPRSDLYSLGTFLWELLVGQPISKGEEASGGAPSILSLRPDVPREIDSFVSKLLSSELAQAFQSAPEAKVALEKALFTLNAKVSKKHLAMWHKSLRLLDSQAGAKEKHEGSGAERNVIAEVVATRKFKAADNKEAPALNPKTEVPLLAHKAVDPAAHTWSKSSTYKEALESEVDEPSAMQLKKKKTLRVALAGLFSFCVLAGAVVFFFLGEIELLLSNSTSPILAKPRELLAVFAHQEGGIVVVQGVRNENAKSFAHGCGDAERPCFCEFLIAPDDNEPASSSEGVYSSKYNLVSCSKNPGSGKFVRVASQGEGARASNAVLVRTELTWRHVLGPDLTKARVRWISQFSCDRTFFEGDGVSAKGELSCPPTQKLATLGATFRYYSFRSLEEGNRQEPINIDTGSICGNASLSGYNCLDSSRTVIFGLYKQAEAPFIIPVSLAGAPYNDAMISIYGFAAEPDGQGICPAGLVKLRQWTASPPTMPESTFVNDHGQLNNRVFASQEPAAFSINRRKNRSPCDGRGNCSFATFEDPTPAQNAAYLGGAELCVFPSPLVSAGDGGDEKLPGAVKERAYEAIIRIKSDIPEYVVFMNGKKMELKNNSISVPMKQELKIELVKQGFKTQRFIVPPQEKDSEPYLIEAPAVPVVLGTIDLATFPPSQATFYMGNDEIFSGSTPVVEKLPVGKYRVKLVDKIGTANEIWITVQEGKTVSVDHLLKKLE